MSAGKRGLLAFAMPCRGRALQKQRDAAADTANLDAGNAKGDGFALGASQATKYRRPMFIHIHPVNSWATPTFQNNHQT